MNTINRDAFVQFILLASDTMNTNKDYLIELDAALGDGDLGLTMSAGFNAAKELVIQSAETDIGKLCMQIGMTFAKTVPSTMGTLIASGFMKSAKALKGKTELGQNDFVVFSYEFVSGIMERGKAKPGDRTIIDALYPAYIAAKEAAEQDLNLSAVIASAHQASQEGVEATKKMKAAFGRGVFFGDQVLGKPDQGAIVGQLIYQCFVDIVG